MRFQKIIVWKLILQKNMENFETKARAYALKNAIAYEGRANPGSVISSLFNEGLKKEEMKEYAPKINAIVKEINSMSLSEQKKEFEKLEDEVSHRAEREGLPELPHAEKGVVMRFAPSPSGALHIGHAMTSCLNFDFVKKYGGKFIVRIEDTNPENIYPPAYNLIKKDSEWLFDKKAKIVIQSDRLDIYYKYAKKLIDSHSAYVCTCNAEDFRELAKEKQDCPCRSKSKIENKKDWEKMLNKKGFGEGTAVLRFKTSDKHGGMSHPNPAMRDFPLARINESKHPRQGKKYRVWPLMNLSVSVDDIEMKMTHIIRAKEHRDNAKRQKMIFEVLNKDYPWEAYLGRYKFTDLELSATKITQGIKDGKYSGWDDPKLPSVSALKNKGYKPEAFWKMAEERGLSEVDKVIEKKDFFEVLDRFNSEVSE